MISRFCKCARIDLIRQYHNQVKPTRGSGSKISLVGKEQRSIQKRRQDNERLETTKVVKGPQRTFEPFPFKITEDNKIQTLKGNLTPLHDIPYDEQLSSKSHYCKRGLRLLTQQLYQAGTSIRQDVNRLPCKFKPIIPCTIKENYRTTDEFSIWKGLDGATETVGSLAFPISRHGDSVCLELEDVTTMKPDVTKLNKILNEFIQTKKLCPISYNLGHDGGWRRFIVKNNHLNELMLIGVLNPRTISIQQILDEKNNFRDFMISRSADMGLNLASLFFQACPHQRCPHEKAPFELLYGKPTLEFNVNGVKCMVSPESHIQENIQAYENLIDEVRIIMKENFECSDAEKPIIIDAMCKSGLLAINLADLAHKVIGVDNIGQSIDSAKSTAKINQISNCEFIYSSLEVILERLLEKYCKLDKDIIVIAHVGKKGLLPYVAEAIRGCERINKVIYITPMIEHENCQKDLMRLCQKQSGNSESNSPFIPIQATPIDMLPHCQGCNLVLALQRVEE